MRRYMALIFFMGLLLVSAVLLQRQPTVPAWVALVGAADQGETTGTVVDRTPSGPTFSATDHFYAQTIDIQITDDRAGAEIYYTMDGSTPTTDSARYTAPIRLTATEDVKGVVLKALSVREGVTSRVTTHTYFLGKRIAERFDTLVFSLSTDPAHLYDYDTGILVAGRERDEFVAANPGHEVIPPDPANYNWRGIDSERPVYVEVFTPEGERVVAQGAGVRVSGGWSRAAEYKSLRLIARKSYEPGSTDGTDMPSATGGTDIPSATGGTDMPSATDSTDMTSATGGTDITSATGGTDITSVTGVGKFHYDFFPEDTVRDPYGTPITEYDSLILRNGANDREFGMLRNEAASLLARDAGFDVVTPVRAAAVFVNGEYYGFSWLQVTINEQYLQDLYEAPTAEFEIVGDGDQWFKTENQQTLDELWHMYDYAYKDLTDDALFAELTSLVDIDNMLAYFAFQIYMGNHDWPGGNLKRWRYTGPQIDGLPPELDGRWRYVMYDMDWVLGLYGDDYTLPTFQNVLLYDKKSPLLAAVLARRDMAERFAMMLCDLAANIVTEETVAAYIDVLYGEAKNELFQAMRYRKFPNWVSFKHVLANHADMIAFAKGRGGYIYSSLRGYFDYGHDMVTVAVTVTDTGAYAGAYAKADGRVVLGTQPGVSAQYFAGMTIPISAKTNATVTETTRSAEVMPGLLQLPRLPQLALRTARSYSLLERFTVFDHWIIDGEAVYEPTMHLSTGTNDSGTRTITGLETIQLEMVTRYAPPILAFETAFATADRNGCILINPTDAAVTVRGLYVSDNPVQLDRWALPAVRVRPGEALVLAGKGSTDRNDLYKIKMNFNASPGEALFLSDETGTVLDFMVVGE